MSAAANQATPRVRPGSRREVPIGELKFRSTEIGEETDRLAKNALWAVTGYWFVMVETSFESKLLVITLEQGP
jgi:hypothetical protein